MMRPTSATISTSITSPSTSTGAPSLALGSPVHIAIRATPPAIWAEAREIWQHRELFYFLAWRDLKVRYKQTALGVGWAIGQPLLSVVVSTLIFGRLAHMPSEGVPYPMFFLAGQLPWTLMAAGVGAAANSLSGNSSLVTKVYFPRMIIPGAAVLSGSIDSVIGGAALAFLMVGYRVHASPRLLLIVPLATIIVVLSSAVGGWLAAVTVKYRDVRYVVPFFMQLWFFATPVIYPSSLIPATWRWLLACNPMAGFIDAFRAICFGKTIDGAALTISAAVTVAVFIVAARTFRHIEHTCADYI